MPQIDVDKNLSDYYKGQNLKPQKWGDTGSVAIMAGDRPYLLKGSDAEKFLSAYGTKYEDLQEYSGNKSAVDTDWGAAMKGGYLEPYLGKDYRGNNAYYKGSWRNVSDLESLMASEAGIVPQAQASPAGESTEYQKLFAKQKAAGKTPEQISQGYAAEKQKDIEALNALAGDLSAGASDFKAAGSRDSSGPPSGAVYISNPADLAKYREDQLWRDPNSAKIYALPAGAGDSGPERKNDIAALDSLAADFSVPAGYEKISGALYDTAEKQKAAYSDIKTDPTGKFLYGKPVSGSRKDAAALDSLANDLSGAGAAEKKAPQTLQEALGQAMDSLGYTDAIKAIKSSGEAVSEAIAGLPTRSDLLSEARGAYRLDERYAEMDAMDKDIDSLEAQMRQVEADVKNQYAGSAVSSNRLARLIAAEQKPLREKYQVAVDARNTLANQINRDEALASTRAQAAYDDAYRDVEAAKAGYEMLRDNFALMQVGLAPQLEATMEDFRKSTAVDDVLTTFTTDTGTVVAMLRNPSTGDISMFDTGFKEPKESKQVEMGGYLWNYDPSSGQLTKLGGPGPAQSGGDSGFGAYPSSYKEWMLAGSPGTYADWIKKTDLRPLPASQTVLLSEGKQLPAVLDSLDGILEDQADLFGPARGLLTLNPWDKEHKKIDDDLRRASQTIGRYMEGGVLRKEDEEKYRKMLPQITDTVEVAKDKLEGIKTLLAHKSQQYLDDFEAAGFDVSGFVGKLPSISGSSGSSSSGTPAAGGMSLVGGGSYDPADVSSMRSKYDY